MPDIQNIPTTQYIGPRIIPHLWDPILWDASTQYDALAVVQYNGVPYIARYVPPQGTLPTNTEYWVRWADFNAQMAQLQQTVESFDNRITANATDIDTLEAIVPRSAFSATNTVQKAIKDEATARQQAVSAEASARESADSALGTRITSETSARTSADTALGNRITSETSARESADNALEQSLQGQITALARQITNANKRKFVLIGDSYLLGVHANGATTDGYGWGHYFANVIPHDTILERGNGGSGFWSEGTTAPYSGMDFSEMVYQLQQNMAASDRAEIDCVVFQGGYNDGQHIDSVGASAANTRMGNALDLARTTFPNATIVVAFTDCGPVPIPKTHCRAYWMYQNCAIRHGAQFIGCVNSTFAYSTHSYDNIHPTAAAQQSIGALIASATAGNTQDYQVGGTDSLFFITPEHEIGIHVEHAFTDSEISAGSPYLIGETKVCAWNQKYMPCFTYTGSSPWPLVTIRLNTDGKLQVMDMQGVTPTTTGKIYGNGNVSLLSLH